MTKELTVAGELARMTALFEARTITTHMGADPRAARRTGTDTIGCRVSVASKQDSAS